MPLGILALGLAASAAQVSIPDWIRQMSGVLWPLGGGWSMLWIDSGERWSVPVTVYLVFHLFLNAFVYCVLGLVGYVLRERLHR